jgi:hypothetical protein
MVNFWKWSVALVFAAMLTFVGCAQEQNGGEAGGPEGEEQSQPAGEDGGATNDAGEETPPTEPTTEEVDLPGLGESDVDVPE